MQYRDLDFRSLSSDANVESVVKDKAGRVGVPDIVLAERIPVENSDIALAKQWSAEYDFFIARFDFDIDPNPNYGVKWVVITGSLNSQDPPNSRPIALDVFPSTEFADKNWKIEGNFQADVSVGFQPVQSSTKIAMPFSYSPKVAKVDSGTSGSSFHWNFRESQNVQPIGHLDLRIIMIHPKKVEKDPEVEFEVGVKFNRNSRPFLGVDVTRLVEWTTIKLPRNH